MTEGCILRDMTCQDHDKFTAKSQFISHFIARTISEYNLECTPVDTPNVFTLREYSARLTNDHSYELFSGLYIYNEYAAAELSKLKDALRCVEAQLIEACKITTERH